MRGLEKNGICDELTTQGKKSRRVSNLIRKPTSPFLEGKLGGKQWKWIVSCTRLTQKIMFEPESVKTIES